MRTPSWADRWMDGQAGSVPMEAGMWGAEDEGSSSRTVWWCPEMCGVVELFRVEKEI